MAEHPRKRGRRARERFALARGERPQVLVPRALDEALDALEGEVGDLGEVLKLRSEVVDRRTRVAHPVDAGANAY